MAGEDLGINVGENVKAGEQFGKVDQQLKGIGGTLHIVRQEDLERIGKIAWELSEGSQLPVVIVVRAPRKV